MDFVHISSSANPRFKAARLLQTRRGRIKQQGLLLEGARLIEDSISAGYPPALVFFEQEQQTRLQSLLTKLGRTDAEIFSLDAALFAQLSDTVTAQGIVAVSPQPELPIGDTGLSLAVDGVRDPGNLGTLVRTAAAVGVDAIWTLPGVTDIWAPKVMRAGMGAHYRMAIRQAGALSGILARLGEIQCVAADARASVKYTDIDWTIPSLLIVGGEAAGLSASRGLDFVQMVRIPMLSGVESLNVAVAASVILFEAQRQRSPG
ncbi:MAG: RNA methyltransferase [Caldilineales bacterium]|nr:RNA methyltransferase [Caldilineales bacterium]